MDAIVAKIVKQVVARRLATTLTFTGPHDALKADLVTSGRDAVYFAAEIPNPKHNPDEYDMIRGVKDWWHKPTKTVAYLIVDLDTTQGNYSVGQAWTDEGFRRQGLIRRLYDMAWDYARSKGKGFGSGWVQSPLMAQYWEGLVGQGKAESYTDPYNTTGKGWRRIKGARKPVDCHLDSYGLDDLIRTGSGKLYHGTNRQFKRFDMAYIRHDLINRFYKAPGIFLTPRRATAEQYADAARNAMVPAVVVADLVRTNRGAGEVLTRLVGEGRDAWDGLRAEAKAAFPDATYFEAMEMMMGGVDPNTLMDLAKHIEGTRYTDAPETNPLFEATNSLFALWGSAAPTSTPVWVFDALDRLGLDSSEYRPKVYTVEVSGLDRVLVTRSKAEAGKAKAKGYDAVVFCGSDLVDGVPEVVVFDPSNVRVTKVDLVERSESDDSDPIYYNAD